MTAPPGSAARPALGAPITDPGLTAPTTALGPVPVFGPPCPAEIAAANDPPNSSRVGIDDFFNDPTLTALIQQALDGNRELRILTEDAQIARNEIMSRRGAYLPFVNFGTRAAMARPSLFTPEGAVEKNVEYLPGKNFPDPLPDFLLAFNLTWTPDIWRQLRNARDAAIFRYFAALERRNYFVTQLVAEIAENYYRLMALDKRMENLDQTIALQEQSLQMAQSKKEAGRDTELPVQRFAAEVARNRSDKLIVTQEIIEVENRINFLLNRYPQPVERSSAGFFDLDVVSLSAGIPAQLLLNRPDIRQAERELLAAGLDVRVARARFFPVGGISARVGYEAFNFKYLFNPEAVVAGVAGELVTPLVNRLAIKADYFSANARQLQIIYNYQRVVLNAFTEVVNRLSAVENYRASIEIKKQQLAALQTSVEVASRLFQRGRAEYIEVLFAQRDLRDARMVLIDTKRQQLAAIVNTYQALGGGDLLAGIAPEPPQGPKGHQRPLDYLKSACGWWSSPSTGGDPAEKPEGQ